MIYFDLINVYNKEYSKRASNFSFYKFLDLLKGDLCKFLRLSALE